MKNLLTIGPLTALAVPPPRLLGLAARAGADGVGFRLLPAAPGGISYRLMDDAALLRETLAAKAATGMRVLDIEMVRIGPGFDVSAFGSFIETAAALGAAHVLVAGDDPDQTRTAASFAQLCEALRPYGLSADFEFMPWTEVKDLGAAARIVAAAAQPNGGIIVDPLHFERSGSRLEHLAEVPPERFHYAQICDGPAEAPATIEGMIHAARCERLLPGEGRFDLVTLFRALPAGIPVCIETPSDTRAALLGWEEWLRQAVNATRALLARVAAE